MRKSVTQMLKVVVSMTSSDVWYEYTIVMHAQNELMDAIVTTRGAH